MKYKSNSHMLRLITKSELSMLHLCMEDCSTERLMRIRRMLVRSKYTFRYKYDIINALDIEIAFRRKMLDCLPYTEKECFIVLMRWHRLNILGGFMADYRQAIPWNPRKEYRSMHVYYRTRLKAFVSSIWF